MTRRPWTCLAIVALLVGCSDDAGTSTASSQSATDSDMSDSNSEETGDPVDVGPETASLAHRLDPYALGPHQETLPCVQWTLDNDAPLYVQGLTFANLGYFHHSNWFVVPEELYPGEDGYFDCSSRGFDEVAAGSIGTVLFAASTQALVEEQRTVDGAVIKIPARHKVVASLHMQNPGPAAITTEAYLTLDLVHPRRVDTVLLPMRATYFDLDIPAQERSRFTGACDQLGPRYEQVTATFFDVELHYLLPHFHGLGDHFSLTATGGTRDGEELVRLDRSSGQQLGQVFDPPLSLAGVRGLDFACGYDNWRDVDVGWGLGDQEMCVMLALIDSEVVLDLSVATGTVATGTSEDGVIEYEGPCAILALPRNPNQSLPLPSELDVPIAVPDSGDPELPPVPDCVDHDPSVQPTLAPTLANVADAVFGPSCSFGSCHGASGQAGGLNLQAADLLTELLDHEVLGDPGATLVEPGDPENSWLYRLIASCEPQTGGGEVVAHMPKNAPFLLDDEAVALVREWIAAGAMP